MSLSRIYQWGEKIASHLTALNKWQERNLALFSLGVVEAKSCIQQQVAKALYRVGWWRSNQRRLQRLLSNERLDMRQNMVDWARWVISCLVTDEVIVLVDETHLGTHLSMMMVGVAYENRCIPLAWRCYQADDYPAGGQVALIAQLLQIVDEGLPAGCWPLLQADRGIGTSPDLIVQVEALGWRYLFRVQGTSKLVDDDGTDYMLQETVEPGEIWAAEGRVFKKRGQIPAYARVIWEEKQDDPWALVTNDPALSGHEYAIRMWQEASFKDLKSGGWQWDRSHVWMPAHADRLMLVLSLAYAWVLTLGAAFIEAGRATSLRRHADGTFRRRLSVFREGLEHFHNMLRRQQFDYLKLRFIPDDRLCS